MQQGDDTIREDGATVREDDDTIREDGDTVREDGATVREGVGSSPPAAAPAQKAQAGGWLPPALADNWHILKSLPAQGAEAALHVIGPLDSALGAERANQRVAKVYRPGIPVKEDVLRRVQQAELAHVVRLEAYGQDPDSGRWWELMEYVEQDSLSQLLEREGPKLPEDLIRDILRELNDALASLHRLSLEHRDLKPANVLVRSRTPLDLVLADFGIASVVEEAMHFTSMARTLGYASPEAVGGGVSDGESRRNMVTIEHTTSDYWSLGMMLVEMLQGRHPYADETEAQVILRLATQNVEDLTKDIADPGWRKLCRGLLRRTPADRWGAEAVSKWLVDPNDPSLSVAGETAAPQPSVEVPSTPTIHFDGARYATPEELGLALAQDWEKAESFWKRRFRDVRTWVTDGLGLKQLGDALANIDDNAELSLEVQVFRFVYLLAPNAPTMRFRNVDLSMEGLVELGERAVNERDADARATLLTLYAQKVLLLADDLSGKEALAEVAHRWNETVIDYYHLRDEFVAQEVAVPEFDADVFSVLLAGSVPAPAVLAALRQKAHRVSTEDARACPWFRALGTPEDMSIAVLVMLPHLQAPAERQGRISRKRPFRGCVGGIIVGGLFGMHVRWAHEQYARDFAIDGVGDFFGVLMGVILLVVVIFAFYVAGVWYLRGGEGVQRAWHNWRSRAQQRAQRNRQSAASGDRDGSGPSRKDEDEDNEGYAYTEGADDGDGE